MANVRSCPSQHLQDPEGRLLLPAWVDDQWRTSIGQMVGRRAGGREVEERGKKNFFFLLIVMKWIFNMHLSSSGPENLLVGPSLPLV